VIDTIVANIFLYDIYIMPLRDTAYTIDKNSLSMIEFALKKEYRITKKGV